MRKLKVGIVGCGAIGANLALTLNKRFKKTVEVVALCDTDTQRANVLKESLGKARVVSLASLIGSSDLVVEAASAKVSFDVAKQSLLRKKNVLIMSIGGILGREDQLFKIAQKNKTKIYFPSGAICGLDGITALAGAGIEEITLKTIKPPQALQGADYVIKNKINLGEIKEAQIIFKGSAEEAVRAFPQNINVVALLSIAARGLVVPQVEIWVSPGSDKNVHIIEVKSAAAHLEIRCENVPSPDNPKTSYLAVLSAIRTIVGIQEPVRIGN